MNRQIAKKRKRTGRRRMPAVFTMKMQQKIVLFFVIIIAMVLALCVRLTKISRTNGDEYTVKVLSQQNYNSKVLPYKRGDIIDRNGVTLATSIKVYNLILDPKLILTDEKFLNPTLDALNECFGYDKQELTNLIQENSKKSYVVYQKQLSYDEIKKFLDISNDTDNNPYVKGVTFENEYERKYPFSSLASQMIGFTASGNVGIGGIEQQYSDYLNGVDGREYGYVNSDNIMEKVTKNAEDGNNVITTIDFNIQTIVEKYIEQWKQTYQPEKIAAIVMNPNNGEIYAMAGTYSYDLNNPSDLSKYYTEEQLAGMDDNAKLDALNAIWRNYCISDTFEPGSTFKPVTVATAMENGLLHAEDTFLCDGGEQYVKFIQCHKRSGHGVITAADGIAFSCNDVMMQLSRLEGKQLLINYQKRFGFGSKTGIDLPGEASCEGLLFNPDTMIDQDLAVTSFGQGFNCTMIQLAAAFSSIINGGYYYEPHVVSQIVKQNGNIVKTVDVQPVKQTITKTTSDYVKTGLRACVDYGTGKSAAVPGYLISGKTGTAQQTTVAADHYLLSFIGFAPYETPEVVCYVLMDNPSDDSSVVTGSLYAAIMGEVLPYLNIPMDAKETLNQGEDAQGGDIAQSQPETAQPETQPEATSEGNEQETQPETVSNIGEPEMAGENIPGDEENQT